jgi:hypothetical protein
MSPTMQEKIESLINIIQLKIDHSTTEEEAIALFKLLSLDLTPCLQKNIINVFTKFFANRKILEEWKKKQLASFMKNSFTDVILYMYSMSLIDVRCECLVLLKELSLYKDLLDRYDYVIEFMRDHLIPDDLLCYKTEKPKVSTYILNPISTKNFVIDSNNDNFVKAPMVNYFNIVC